MENLFLFIANSILFGIGLAMDAFSISMANGLNDPKMNKSKTCAIAGTFCFFQIIMPLIGWFCVHTIAELFQSFQKFIPYIALVLLCYLGGKMLYEAIKGGDDAENENGGKLTFATLMLQGIATSIDALSVGFTIAEYSPAEALMEAVIIGITTFVICVAGVILGKKFGTKLAGKANVLGGVILILIGIEIFVTNM